MVKKLKFCVNGIWKESSSGKYFDVTDSSTGEIMAKAPCCTKSEVEEAIQAAADAFPEWSATPVTVRAQMMFKWRSILLEHVDELTLLVSKEVGKNFDEARGDVLKTVECTELACSVTVLMQGYSTNEITKGFDTVLYRESLGVFVGIAPFNFPAMLAWGWMIPMAIATGNTYVIKASNLTPMTAIRIMELFCDEAGFPKGVVNLVTCNNEEAELLLTHKHVKGVTFVGSTTVGRHVYATAAANGKRVQALCEAKNHCLVMADADIENAAKVIVNSAFGCAGQRCMALRVVVVQEEIADALVNRIVGQAKEYTVGCAYKPDTKLGAMVTAESKQKVYDWIDKGIKEGAKLVLDGRGVKVPQYENGFFIGATIFDEVKPEMSVGNEEIFGPVLIIKRVKSFNEGIALMNANQFANGSAIFTQSGYFAREFTQKTHGGMVGINVGIPVPSSYFPFTGHKNSFFGDLHVLGRDGIAFFTEAKCVTTRWFDESFKDHKLGTWEGGLNSL